MIILATSLVFLAFFLVPIAFYGGATALARIAPPGGNPALFLAGVAISKAETAILFTALWRYARAAVPGGWIGYAALWFLTFALGEIGQAIGPDYTLTEAAAGLVSEAIYLPLAAWTVARIIGA